MKLAIFSDTHLGFASGTEREQESFENAANAFRICLEQKADCILLLGDIFDESVPSQECWREAFRVFSAVQGHASTVMLRKIKGGGEEAIVPGNVPVISIHGTHEFRGKRFANALEVMEKAGFLFHLHVAVMVIEKGGEKIAVHGLGGVPEKKALDALHAFNPVPLPGMKNILALHQSFKELLPFDDDMVATISFSDLPPGFDMVCNGHFHWGVFQDIGGTKFFIPGSTIVTQMKRLESEKPKGVFVFDTKTMGNEFFPLPNQRKLLYETIQFENATPGIVAERTRSVLSGLLDGNEFGQKPMVRIKLKGTLAKGISSSDIPLQEILKPFEVRAIISADKRFSENSFLKKIEELRALQRNRKSINTLGLNLLEKNLKETGFNNAIDVRELFELLGEGNVDEAIALVSGAKK